MNGEIVQNARAIIAHFEGHGWGRGGATAYHDQGEIDAFVQYGPRMLVALGNLITEIDELHAALAARVEPEVVADEGVPVDDERPEIVTIEEVEAPVEPEAEPDVEPERPAPRPRASARRGR